MEKYIIYPVFMVLLLIGNRFDAKRYKNRTGEELDEYFLLGGYVLILIFFLTS